MEDKKALNADFNKEKNGKGDSDSASSSSDAEDESDGMEDEEMVLDDDEHVETMEKMNFDFEAFPPAEENSPEIEALLGQIFLRADVDCKGLAGAIVAQAPLGCVYRPAEDEVPMEEDGDDAEDGSIVYGVLSLVALNGGEKFQSAICDLLINRAKKFASKEVYHLIEKSLTAQSRGPDKVAILVNERLLHFPAQISGPGFASLSQDYNSLPKKKRFQHILLIMKVRIADEADGQQPATKKRPIMHSGETGSVAEAARGDQSAKAKAKRKMGKAERKRVRAAQLAEADIIYDNPEEELLFMANGIGTCPAPPPPPHFQYPVESEVDKASKFHAIRRDGRVYRPYRRVCLLTEEQFLQFADTVAKADL